SILVHPAWRHSFILGTTFIIFSSSVMFSAGPVLLYRNVEYSSVLRLVLSLAEASSKKRSHKRMSHVPGTTSNTMLRCWASFNASLVPCVSLLLEMSSQLGWWCEVEAYL
ncbi:unnamed protein product, partial [Ectocarpus sp. 12 AP-2014]